MKDNNIQLTPALQKIMTEFIPGLAMREGEEPLKTAVAGLQQAEDKRLLAELALHIITHKEVPVWFENTSEQTPTEVLNMLVVYSPLTFLDVIKQEIITEAQFSWLHRELDFKSLMMAAGRLNKNKTALLTIYEKLYFQLGKIAVKGIAASEIQYLLFRKLLKAWTSGNWRIVSTEQIWNELTWDVCVKRGVAKKELLQGIEKIKMRLPLSMQVALEQWKDRERAANVEKVILPKPAALLKTSATKPAKGGIPVKNAGMVLISSYIEMLLERLGITGAKKFRDDEARADAPHYLQYVVTGLSATEESLLPLNKVLCGIPLSEPLREGINITDEHKKLINGLLTAMIGYWPAIGNCSTDGFRGNWLVREGLLLEHDDKWELTVEKRAYDVLIHQSPFAFSIIKLPWMSKPLHVTWPY